MAEPASPNTIGVKIKLTFLFMGNYLIMSQVQGVMILFVINDNICAAISAWYKTYTEELVDIMLDNVRIDG